MKRRKTSDSKLMKLALQPLRKNPARCIPFKTRAKQLRREAGEHVRDARKLERKSKRNPSRRAAADEAARRFEAFTGHTATKEFRFRQRPIRTGLAVGKLVGVMYEATRDGATDKYFHRFKKSSQPLLIANHDGSSFGIVGGRSRFTDRGIVDE